MKKVILLLISLFFIFACNTSKEKSTPEPSKKQTIETPSTSKEVKEDNSISPELNTDSETQEKEITKALEVNNSEKKITKEEVIKEIQTRVENGLKEKKELY